MVQDTIEEGGLKSVLERHGLKLVQVAADGNCQFHALADQLWWVSIQKIVMISIFYFFFQPWLNSSTCPCPCRRLLGEIVDHTELRRAVVEVLRRNPANYDRTIVWKMISYYNNANPTDQMDTWDEYVDRLGRAGTRGDHVTLQAAADMLGETVALYSASSDQPTPISPRSAQDENPQEEKPILHIAYNGSNHYYSTEPSDSDQRPDGVQAGHVSIHQRRKKKLQEMLARSLHWDADDRFKKMYEGYKGKRTVESYDAEDMESDAGPLLDKSSSQVGPQDQRWCGKLFNPRLLGTTLEYSYIKNAYSGNIDDDVLNAWKQLSDVPYKVDLGVAVYKKEIREIVQLISRKRSLPRSAPSYSIAASKYPLGVILQGQELSTGESLQLVASIRKNTPVWRYIRTCLHKIYIKAKEERKNGGIDKNNPSWNRWNELLEGIIKTEFALVRRGVTQMYGQGLVPCDPESPLGRHLGEIRKKDEELECILDRLEMVLGSERAKSRLEGDSDKCREYIAWGPHLFECFLKKTVAECLSEHYQLRDSYEVVKGQVKLYLQTYGDELIPDIVIRKKDTMSNEFVAYIDAKLYKEFDGKTVEFTGKMENYLNGKRCRDAEQGQRTEKRGVTFVAIYGDVAPPAMPSAMRTQQPQMVLYCHINRKSLQEVNNTVKEKIRDALNFLFPNYADNSG